MYVGVVKNKLSHGHYNLTALCLFIRKVLTFLLHKLPTTILLIDMYVYVPRLAQTGNQVPVPT